MNRLTLAISFTIGGILLFLLTAASSNTDFLAHQFTYLLGLNFVVVGLLGSLVFFQLKKLYKEYKTKQFGSKLKSRLVLLFVLMALLPGAVIYTVSLQFVTGSIESWFNVRVDRALEGGVSLGRNVLDNLTRRTRQQTQDIAASLAEQPEAISTHLNRLREQYDLTTATMFDLNGHIFAYTSSEKTQDLLPNLPELQTLRQIAKTLPYVSIEGDTETGLFIHVITNVPARDLKSEDVYVLTTFSVPKELSGPANDVQTAYKEYQQLSFSRVALKKIYAITLTLTLLLALLAAISSAIFFAERLVAPLLLLSEGTQAVAQGDFSPRKTLPQRDELGVLTQSFSQMTLQLEEARAQNEQDHAIIESSRAYLESVLNNISTGVLTFDEQFHLCAVNQAAISILKDDLKGFEEISLSAWPRQELLKNLFLEMMHNSKALDWHQQIEIPKVDNQSITLHIHGARLPSLSGGGWVVVFDDVSKLVAAQRTAAWGEVARRLAHEIKNPLTPIQLSAERLAIKLEKQLPDEESKKMLLKATDTIVNQVEAMKSLVNNFRDFAKLPTPNLKPINLNALITDLLGLYENSSMQVVLQLHQTLPLILGDTSLLRQVFHNLLQNAQDAVSEKQTKCITIITKMKDTFVQFKLQDTGTGFPPKILENAFEPYVTTKKRGTGLGLAIVKKIIDEHNSEIKLSNLAEGGAEISILFKIADTEKT